MKEGETMKKVLNSRYIKKNVFPLETNLMIEQDLCTFHSMKHTAFAWQNQGRIFSDKSLHCTLKEQFGVMDYYVNSANREAQALLSSQKELNNGYLKDTRELLKEVRKKLKQKETTLCKYRKAKERLRIWSKKSGIPERLKLKLSGVTVYPSGLVSVQFGRYRKDFFCIYDFEHMWLDRQIQKLKSIQRSLKNKIHHLEQKCLQLENKTQYKVVFGGKKNTPVQRKKNRKKRMAITGRNDSKNGNFVFTYSLLDHTLTYRSMTRLDNYIVFPNVRFPYGQKELEDTIRTNFISSDKKTPVCWEIEDCGNAWRINCTIEFPDVEQKNDYFGEGCVGIDMNYDNISLSETDKYGNLFVHRIYPFDMEKKSSGQITQILSLMLEDIFRYALSVKKPVVMEQIKSIQRMRFYDKNTKRTRRISMFACNKIQQLAEHKSNKYHTALTYINPAYTSMLGKLKYQKRYGLSVHEAASFVIARRGQGYKERLPKWLRSYLFEQLQQSKNLPYQKQYRLIYKEYKENKTSLFRWESLLMSGI